MKLFAEFLSKLTGFKWLISFFLIFLALQLYQTAFFSWDPLVYLFQGKWFCGNQVYFEWLRPPLPGVIGCLLGASDFSVFLSSGLASLAYFIAVTFIFLKERKTQNIDQFAFAAFSFLFPSILIFSNAGGDLFALSFMLLALAAEGSFTKGIFFALASLSRYNYLVFIIVFVTQIKLKEWPRFIMPILVFWFPWLAFNYFETGNPLFSLEDSVYLNIQQKGFFAGLEIYHIILIAFFAVTMLLAKRNGKFNDFAKAFNLTAVISVIQFLLSGIKEHRFLNFLVPAQSLNISAIRSGKIRFLMFSFLIIFMLAGGFLVYELKPNSPVIPQNSFIKNCKVMSDSWMYFYPAGIVAEPLPGKGSFEYFLNEGTTLVIYSRNLVDLNDFKKYSSVKTGNYLIIKPDNCKEPPKSYVLKVWRGDWKAVNG